MRKSRILIVENEAIVARDLSGQLRELGYEVAGQAAAGEAALALAEQSRLDLVLMDIHLKGVLDGIAAAQAIRERFAIPVIFISAYLEDSVLDRAKAAHPFGYVSKPFQSNELKMVIDLALTKHQAETAMRQVYEEQAAILRTAMDGFWSVDMRGRILEVNDAACRMTGYSREEFLRLSIADLEDDESPDEILAHIQRIKESGGVRFERQHRCKDGHLVDVELSVNYLTTSGGRLFCFLRDITERKRAEEETRRNDARFRSLSSLLQYRGATTQDFLDFALNEAIKLTGSKLGYIYFYHADRKQFVLNTWSKEVMKECSVVNPQTCYELDQTGIWGEAVRQRQPILLNDFEAAHPLKKGYPEGHAKLRKYLTLPIFNGDQIVAVVAVANKEGDYDDADIRQLRLLMDAVWKVVERRNAVEALTFSEEKLLYFQKAVDGAQDAIGMSTPDGRHYYQNEAFSKLFGLSVAEVDGASGPPETVYADKRMGREVFDTIKNGDLWVGEVKMLDKDKNEKDIFLRAYSIKDKEGKLAGLVGIHTDITERKRAEAKLITIMKAVESTSDAVGMSDAQGRHFYQNGALSKLFGYATAEELQAAGGGPVVVKDPEVAREMFEKIMSGKTWTGELEMVTKSGRVFPAYERADAITGNDGQIIGLIGIITDITERKRAEEVIQDSLHEKESLLKEIHHRVKNNLQIISSLLRLQSGQIDNPIAKAALQDMQNRVRSMALIHEHLYRSENLAQVDLAAYLKQLCTHLFHALAEHPKAIQLQLNLASIRLDIDQAIPCGLLVNELVSNALKHAFPKGRTGEVLVELQPVADGPGLRLRVADNGVGLPAGFDLNNLTSLGLQLVRDLPRQLHGQLQINRDEGTAFEVVFAPHRAGLTSGVKGCKLET